MSDSQTQSLFQFLTSANAWQLYVFILVLIVIVTLITRFLGLDIKTKFFSLGSSEKFQSKERFILLKQKEYAHAACTAMLATISRLDTGLDSWRTRCVLEYVYDEIIDWITFNHLTTDPDYVATKASALRAIVRSNVEKDLFFTDEFNRTIDTFTKNTLTELVRIRTVITKDGSHAVV